jgi:hypothetical protein
MAAVVEHGGGASVGLGPRATGAATKEHGGVTLGVKELGGCGVQMRSRLGTAAWAMTKDWGDANGHEGVEHRGGAGQGTTAGARMSLKEELDGRQRAAPNCCCRSS